MSLEALVLVSCLAFKAAPKHFDCLVARLASLFLVGCSLNVEATEGNILLQHFVKFA